MANHYNYVSLLAKDSGNIAYTNTPLFFHFFAAVIVNAFNVPVGLALNLIGLLFFALLPFSVYKLCRLFSEDKTVPLLAALFSMLIQSVLDPSSLLAGLPSRAAMALVPLILYLFLSKRFIFAGLVMGLLAITHLSWPVAIILVFLAVLLGFFGGKKINFAGIIKFFVASLFAPLVYLFFYNAGLAAHASKIIFSFNPTPYSLFGLWVSPFYLPLMFLPLFAVLLALVGLAKSAKTREFFGKHAFFSLWLLLLAVGTQSYFIFSEFDNASVVFAPGRLKAFLIFPIAFFASVATVWLSKKTKKDLLTVAVVCVLMLLFSVPSILNSSKTIRHTETQLELIEKVSQKYSDEMILSAPWLDYGASMIIGNIVTKSGNSPARLADKYLFFSSQKTFNRFDRVLLLIDNGDSRQKSFIDLHASDFEIVFSNADFSLFEYKKLVGNNYSLKDAAGAFSLAMNDSNIFLQQLLFGEPLKLKFSSGSEAACISVFREAKAAECDSNSIDFEFSGDRNAILDLLTNYNADLFVYLALWHFDHKELEIKPLKGNLVLEKKTLIKLPALEFSVFLKDINLTAFVESTSGSVFFETKKGKAPGTIDLSLKFFARAIKWANPFSSQYGQPNIVFGLIFAFLLGA